VFLNQSLQSYYTPEEYVDEWINFDSLEQTQKEILKEL